MSTKTLNESELLMRAKEVYPMLVEHGFISPGRPWDQASEADQQSTKQLVSALAGLDHWAR